MTCRLIAPNRREWRTDMWVAAIDFQKAFDSIQHDAIWRSLRNHSVSEQYICLLKKLHADLRATVLTDVESDEYGIARGTKQGDPLSSLLFNSILLFNQQRTRTLGLGTKRAVASNRETRKEIAIPSSDLLTTFL